MVSVEELYKEFGTLADAKDKASEHIDSYKVLLKAVTSGVSEKRLAAQFISRFFKFFPDLAEESINALMDLCEDKDSSIRRSAIKELPSLCKIDMKHTARLSDVLTQLLGTGEHAEQLTIHQALVQLVSIDAKATLNGIFHQILTPESTNREQAIKFLTIKKKAFPESAWTKEAQEELLEKCKKVMEDINGEEFVSLMGLLTSCGHLQSLQGRKQLLELVTEQAALEEDFDTSDADSLSRLVVCTRQAVPLCSRNVHSGKFVSYICARVLPVLASVEATEEEGVDVKLELLKLVAELAPFSGDGFDLNKAMTGVHAALLTYMPAPPEEVIEQTNGNAADPGLEFSPVECLLSTLHELGKKDDKFLLEETDAERAREFKKRLQFFARGTQAYMRSLKQALTGKNAQDMKSDENKLKLAGLKVTTNINLLIKDLMHVPPSYKAQINLSWKPVQTQESQLKRQSSAEAATGPKVAKLDQQRYAPPGGKFSEKAGTFRGGRGRGGRGNNRGRGNRGYRGGRGNYEGYY